VSGHVRARFVPRPDDRTQTLPPCGDERPDYVNTNQRLVSQKNQYGAGLFRGLRLDRGYAELNRMGETETGCVVDDRVQPAGSSKCESGLIVGGNDSMPTIEQPALSGGRHDFEHIGEEWAAMVQGVEFIPAESAALPGGQDQGVCVQPHMGESA
jgi:hypothetical protein